MTAPEVEVIAASSGTEPPATRLRYAVRNAGPQPVWVVDDRWLTWRQSAREIELSFRRERLQPGAVPFGYFAPQVAELPPGAELQRELELTWPQPLSPLWNEAPVAAPPPGAYAARLRIGYGTSPAPDDPRPGEPAEAATLRWQRDALSPPHPVEVPPYPQVAAP
ncbi:hypothetical protein ACFQX4_19315 [Roseomonas sp. GCM10028921]